MNSSTNGPLGWIDAELAALENQDLRRRLATRSSPQSPRMVIDGRELVNFGSNDYLGLAADPRLAAAVAQAVQARGLGERGQSVDHRPRRVARPLGRAAGRNGGQPRPPCLFPSGFAANLGAVAALVGGATWSFPTAITTPACWTVAGSPAPMSASIPTATGSALDGLLARAAGHRRRLIVTDSLFSMDGDLAPLVELTDLAARRGAMLLMDEAHATGVFGRHGRGVAEHLGVDERVAAGRPSAWARSARPWACAGGFVAGSRTLVEWLLNRARSYIYSTAAPAATAAAALAALDIVAAEPQRGVELLARAASLRDALAVAGLGRGPFAESDHSDSRGHASPRGGAFGPAARARPVGPGHPTADGARGPISFASQSDRGPHAGDGRDAIACLA